METRSNVGELIRIHPGKLFVGSCFSLIATAVAFAMIGAIMGPLKEHFVLTNEQVGWIGGAALWGFTISIFIFGPLCDALGMKFLLRLAFLGHSIGVLVMIFAAQISVSLHYEPFIVLFSGALILAMGNGLVEAACNPLVTTIYPERKTQMLNKFHVWFPGGIVIGGLIAFGLDQTGITSWQIKLAVILVPTVIYGILFLRQKFPATERLQSGVSFGQMFRNTLLRPLFILLFFCMMITASLELGPNRWVPAVLQSAGIPGILVLVWINLLMAVLRYYAGPVVHRLSPPGVLLCSAIIAGVGLLWLSFTASLGMAIMAGTVFAVGVCYFWPTMLGFTSERVPKGGALALALMGGIGMASVGLVTSPMMGRVADSHINDRLTPTQTIACFESAVETLPALQVAAKGKTGADIGHAITLSKQVIDNYKSYGQLPKIDTANALRSIIVSAPASDAAAKAKDILGPAENYGGKLSFRAVAPFSIVLIIVFGVLYVRDMFGGGYKVEKISSAETV